MASSSRYVRESNASTSTHIIKRRYISSSDDEDEEKMPPPRTPTSRKVRLTSPKTKLWSKPQQSVLEAVMSGNGHHNDHTTQPNEYVIPVMNRSDEYSNDLEVLRSGEAAELTMSKIKILKESTSNYSQMATLPMPMLRRAPVAPSPIMNLTDNRSVNSTNSLESLPRMIPALKATAKRVSVPRHVWSFKIREEFLPSQDQLEAQDWTQFADSLTWSPDSLRTDLNFRSKAKWLKYGLVPVTVQADKDGDDGDENTDDDAEIQTRLFWKGSVAFIKKITRSKVIHLLRADPSKIQFKRADAQNTGLDPESVMGNSFNSIEGFGTDYEEDDWGFGGDYVDPLLSSETDDTSSIASKSSYKAGPPNTSNSTRNNVNKETAKESCQSSGFIFPFRTSNGRKGSGSSSFTTENSVYQEAFKQSTATAALHHLQQVRPKDLALHSVAITRYINKFYANRPSRESYPLSSFTFLRIPNKMLQSRVIIITGESGCGKTEYVRAHFSNPILITRLEELLDLACWDSFDGLILDEPALIDSVQNSSELKYFFDKSISRTIKLKYNNVIRIPAGIRRVIVSCKTDREMYTEWKLKETEANYIKTKVYAVRLPKGKIYSKGSTSASASTSTSFSTSSQARQASNSNAMNV